MIENEIVQNDLKSNKQIDNEELAFSSPTSSYEFSDNNYSNSYDYPSKMSTDIHPYIEIGKCLQNLRKSVFDICYDELMTPSEKAKHNVKFKELQTDANSSSTQTESATPDIKFEAFSSSYSLKTPNTENYNESNKGRNVQEAVNEIVNSEAVFREICEETPNNQLKSSNEISNVQVIQEILKLQNEKFKVMASEIEYWKNKATSNEGLNSDRKSESIVQADITLNIDEEVQTDMGNNVNTSLSETEYSYSFNRDIESRQDEIDRLQAVYEDLSEKFQSLITENKNLESDVEDKDEEIGKLKEKISELEENLFQKSKTISSENQKLELGNEEKQELKQRYEKIIASLEEENTKLSSLVDDLTSDLDSTRAALLDHEKDNLNIRNELHKTQLEKDKKIGELELSEKKFNDLSKNLMKKDEQLKSLRHEFNELVKIKQELNDPLSLTLNKFQLNEKDIDFQYEAELLKNQLEESKKSESFYKSQCTELQNEHTLEIQRFRESFESQKSIYLERYEMEKKKVVEKCTQLEETTRDKERVIFKLQDQLSHKENEIRDLTAKISSLGDYNHDLLKNIELNKDELIGLKKSLERSNKIIQNLREEIDAQKLTILEIHSSSKQNDQTISSLNHTIDGLTSHFRSYLESDVNYFEFLLDLFNSSNSLSTPPRLKKKSRPTTPSTSVSTHLQSYLENMDPSIVSLGKQVECMRDELSTKGVKLVQDRNQLNSQLISVKSNLDEAEKNCTDIKKESQLALEDKKETIASLQSEISQKELIFENEFSKWKLEKEGLVEQISSLDQLDDQQNFFIEQMKKGLQLIVDSLYQCSLSIEEVEGAYVWSKDLSHLKLNKKKFPIDQLNSQSSLFKAMEKIAKAVESKIKKSLNLFIKKAFIFNKDFHAYFKALLSSLPNEEDKASSADEVDIHSIKNKRYKLFESLLMQESDTNSLLCSMEDRVVRFIQSHLNITQQMDLKKEDVRAKNEQINELKALISNEQLKISHLTSKQSNLMSDYDQQVAKNEELKQLLDQSQLHLTTSKQDCQRLQKELDQRIHSMTEINNHNDRLTNENKSLQTDLDKMSQLFRSVQEKYNLIKAENKELKADLASRIEELESLNESLAKVKIENAQFQCRNDESRSQQMKISSQLQELEAEKMDLINATEVANELNHQLESQIMHLEETLSRKELACHNLEKVLQESNQSRLESNEDIQQQKCLVSDLRSKIEMAKEEATRLSSEIQTLKLDNEGKTSRILTLENSLKSVSHQLETLRFTLSSSQIIGKQEANKDYLRAEPNDMAGIEKASTSQLNYPPNFEEPTLHMAKIQAEIDRLNRENETLQKSSIQQQNRIECLETMLNDADSLVNESRTQLSSQKEEIKTILSKKQSFEEQNRVISSELKEMTLKNHEFQKKISFLERKLQDLSHDYERKTEELEDLSSSYLDEKQVRLDKFKDEVEQYKLKLAETSKSLFDLQALSEEYKNRYQQASSAISVHQKQAEAYAKQISQLEGQVQMHSSELSRVNFELESKNSQISLLEESTKKLMSENKKVIDENKKIHLDLSELKVELPSLREELQRLTSEVELKKIEVGEKEKSIEEKTNLVQSKDSELKQQLKTLQNVRLELSTAQSELAYLNEQLDNSNNELKALRNRFSNSESEHRARLFELENQVESLQSENQSLKKEKEKICREKVELSDRIKPLEQLSEHQSDDLAELRKKNLTLESLKSKLISEKEEAGRQCEIYSDEITYLTQSHAELTHRFKELNQNFLGLKRDYTSSENDRQEKTQLLDEKSNKLEALVNTMSDLKQYIAHLEKEKAGIESQLSHVQHQISYEKEKELRQLREEIQNLSEDNRCLSQDYQDLKAELADLRRKEQDSLQHASMADSLRLKTKEMQQRDKVINELTLLNEELEYKIADLNREFDESVAKLDVYEENLRSLNEQNNLIVSQLVSRNKEYNKLHLEHQDLEDSFEELSQDFDKSRSENIELNKNMENMQVVLESQIHDLKLNNEFKDREIQFVQQNIEYFKAENSRLLSEINDMRATNQELQKTILNLPKISQNIPKEHALSSVHLESSSPFTSSVPTEKSELLQRKIEQLEVQNKSLVEEIQKLNLKRSFDSIDNLNDQLKKSIEEKSNIECQLREAKFENEMLQNRIFLLHKNYDLLLVDFHSLAKLNSPTVTLLNSSLPGARSINEAGSMKRDNTHLNNATQNNLSAEKIPSSLETQENLHSLAGGEGTISKNQLNELIKAIHSLNQTHFKNSMPREEFSSTTSRPNDALGAQEESTPKLDRQLSMDSQQIKQLESELEAKIAEIENLLSSNSHMKIQLRDLEDQLSNKSRYIEELKTKYQEEIEALNDKINTLNQYHKDSQGLDDLVTQLRAEVSSLQEDLVEQQQKTNETSRSLDEQISQKDSEILFLTQSNHQLKEAQEALIRQKFLIEEELNGMKLIAQDSEEFINQIISDNQDLASQNQQLNDNIHRNEKHLNLVKEQLAQKDYESQAFLQSVFQTVRSKLLANPELHISDFDLKEYESKVLTLKPEQLSALVVSMLDQLEQGLSERNVIYDEQKKLLENIETLQKQNEVDHSAYETDSELYIGQIKALKTQMESLQASYDAKCENLNSIMNENECLENNFRLLKGNMAKNDDIIQSLKASNQELNLTCQSLMDELKNSIEFQSDADQLSKQKVQLETLQKKNDALTLQVQQLKQSHMDEIQQLDASNKKLALGLEKYESEIKDKALKYSQVVSELQALQAKDTTLSSDLQLLRTQLQAKDAELSANSYEKIHFKSRFYQIFHSFGLDIDSFDFSEKSMKELSDSVQRSMNEYHQLETHFSSWLDQFSQFLSYYLNLLAKFPLSSLNESADDYECKENASVSSSYLKLSELLSRLKDMVTSEPLALSKLGNEYLIDAIFKTLKEDFQVLTELFLRLINDFKTKSETCSHLTKENQTLKNEITKAIENNEAKLSCALNDLKSQFEQQNDDLKSQLEESNQLVQVLRNQLDQSAASLEATIAEAEKESTYYKSKNELLESQLKQQLEYRLKIERNISQFDQFLHRKGMKSSQSSTSNHAPKFDISSKDPEQIADFSVFFEQLQHTLRENRRYKRLCNNQQICIMALRLLVDHSEKNILSVEESTWTKKSLSGQKKVVSTETSSSAKFIQENDDA